MQSGLSFSGVNEQFNIDLFVLSRYLDACYGAMGSEQPSDVSLAWGQANMAAAAGTVATIEDWCAMVGVQYGEAQSSAPSEEEKVLALRIAGVPFTPKKEDDELPATKTKAV